MEVAYAVGLMATDGNLAGDRRHLSFVSRDADLVETLRRCLRVTTEARAIRTPRGGTLFRVQWGSRILYDWLLAVGLMPAKSRKLGALVVPEAYFADFFRGCVDGDGSVLVYTDRTGLKAGYVYERLYVSLVSASLTVRGVDSDDDPAVDRGCRSCPSRRQAGPSTGMDASLRQGQLYSDPALDLSFAGRAVPRAQAGQGREVPLAPRLGVETPSRATAGRLAIQCRGATSWVEGDRAGVEKWQTRGAQNAVPARACGFKSRPRYHPSLTSRRAAGNLVNLWGCSSVGRAQGWQSWGQGFDSPQLHQITDAGLRSHLQPRVAVWRL